MTTAYPTALDAFSNPTSNSNMNDSLVVHSEQHANANDAIEALQAKIGIDNSTNPNSIDYKLKNARLVSETPAGTINGVNTTFTLSKLPDGDIFAFVDSNILPKTGYTLTTSTVVFDVAPATSIIVIYMTKVA